ncbi:pyridoxal-phosphate dependent enzyme [Halorubrum sp. Hd13]|uniref:threonine synthase n=1 Tax=Halorubrum sp. Hd13 TaxID=1480728 RepID=UPI000B98B6AB|nr:pyridoxal-phosphate dependent enzyme [Halorubrum sp. Hd13]OYR47592.1 threonine synthase [Halorubrum sp. Hd13]
MSPALRCYRCGDRYRDPLRVRCDCGEPLWFEPDAAAFGWEDCRAYDGAWRYEPLLPIDRPEGVARAAGGTPLVRSEGLDDAAGCRVYVKDEGEHPTGAYKDRGSAAAVPHAVAAADGAVGTVSYGNMAMSTAAHAASLDRECVVLVPDDISPVRLELIGQYEPTIVRVDGDYGALYGDALDLSDELPVRFLVSDAPARISGYATAMFEICEAFAPDAPDAVVLPTSSGGFASGLWRGIRDLEAAGLLDDPPRLCLVQTAASDPITRAFESGATDPTPIAPDETGETIAHSIGNPDPPSGGRALAAVRDTAGAVVSVDDDEIRAAQRRFAVDGGFCVEPASAASLAGATRLSERGEIDDDDAVVLVPTGTGFKELGTGDASVATERTNRSALPELLASLLCAS